MYTHRRTRRRRGHGKVLFSGVIVLICASYTGLTLAWPLRSIQPIDTVTERTIPASTSTAWPAYGHSAIGSSEHGILAQSSADKKQVPIASITKIITALTILEAKPLKQGETGPNITFSANDVARYNQYIAADGSVAPVSLGMQISQQQLMQGMLVKSANNYADSAAIWAYGSMDAYLLAAKTYLMKHNFTNTHVVDATGFSPGSVSTAPELVAIGLHAMKNPVIADIVAQKSSVIPGVGTLHNTNVLLGTDGIVGLKTGTTDEAGSCLLYASRHVVAGENITLVGVVLGAPNHPTLFSDVAKLNREASKQIAIRTTSKPNEIYATYLTPWGATASATSSKKQAITWSSAPVRITSKVHAVVPGTPPHTPPGTITMKHGEKNHTYNLKLSKQLDEPSWFWRVTHPGYVFNL